MRFLSLFFFLLFVANSAVAMGEREEKPEQCTHLYVDMNGSIFAVPVENRIVILDRDNPRKLVTGKNCTCTRSNPCKPGGITMKDPSDFLHSAKGYASIWPSFGLHTGKDTYLNVKEELARDGKSIADLPDFHGFYRLDKTIGWFLLISKGDFLTPSGNPQVLSCHMNNYGRHVNMGEPARIRCSVGAMWKNGISLSLRQNSGHVPYEKWPDIFSELIDYMNSIQLNNATIQ